MDDQVQGTLTSLRRATMVGGPERSGNFPCCFVVAIVTKVFSQAVPSTRGAKLDGVISYHQIISSLGLPRVIYCTRYVLPGTVYRKAQTFPADPPIQN